MTCDRVQFEVSRAIDEDRDLSAFGDHLSVCSDCSEFAAVSLEFGERYRRQVHQGIDRLRPGAAPASRTLSPARWLIPLAAALLVLLSVPRRPAAAGPSVSSAPASARVSLYDHVFADPVDLQVLAWTGEPPLPRRLDQDLPSSLLVDFEPSVSLPAGLRF